jgi:HPt (histidine-containing phosphotransfer) domain-containing protein
VRREDPEDELDPALEQLRREYLVQGSAHLAALRRGIAAFAAGAAAAATGLRAQFHNLAGSGGAYGFPEISAVAREMELWLATAPTADPDAAAHLAQGLSRLDAAFARARGELESSA